MSDPWDVDYFEAAKQQKEAWHVPRPIVDAFVEEDCPGCERHVGALLIDGPDPVFADVQCPRCSHVWVVCFREGRWRRCED